MKRPTGVTVICVLLFFIGIVGLIQSFSTMDDVDTVAGIIQLIVSAAVILCGVGCWRLQQWAWLGTIVLMAIGTANVLQIWIRYSDRIIVSRVLWPLIIYVAVIAYLLQPQIKATFEK